MRLPTALAALSALSLNPVTLIFVVCAIALTAGTFSFGYECLSVTSSPILNGCIMLGGTLVGLTLVGLVAYRPADLTDPK